ncbi:hypothetical protein EDC01DRAFT_10113 [Geopyxis carbonaria]|nr:hypothetical protein EDC01DRAFT_10113 [Geopyxis carbonaria]
MSDAPPLPPPKPVSRTATPTTAAAPAAPPPPPPTSLVPSEPFVPSFLHDKPLSDLHTLLSSPPLLDSLFTATHPTSHSTTSALTTALTSNAAHAAHLSALETALIAQRAAVQQKLVAARALEGKWREKEQEMYVALNAFSSPALYARMVAAVEEAERESDVVAEAMVEGAAGGDVEAWVRGYREGRKKVGLRRERVGRWDEGRVGGWR